MPLLVIIISPERYRVIITFVAVIVALTITGLLSATAGGANKAKATLRVVVGGAIAMMVTYGIGKLVGSHTF